MLDFAWNCIVLMVTSLLCLALSTPTPFTSAFMQVAVYFKSVIKSIFFIWYYNFRIAEFAVTSNIAHYSNTSFSIDLQHWQLSFSKCSKRALMIWLACSIVLLLLLLLLTRWLIYLSPFTCSGLTSIPFFVSKTWT